jgi:DNA/RNA-binding domain of Phe-tRNA-synthetase-like protein
MRDTTAESGYEVSVSLEIGDEAAVIGIVAAAGISVTPTPAEFSALLDSLVALRAREDFPPPARKEAVRALLRRGGFKPSGRNKPASEYLAQAAREGRFPLINAPVDINNYLSLKTGIPISLLDLSGFASPEASISGGGFALVLRYGRAGESYVFNSAGQEIDLAGLVCACSAGFPLGNPCKDSVAGKLKDATADAVGILYGSVDSIGIGGMEAACGEFALLLSNYAGAGRTAWSVVSRLKERARIRID